MTDSNPVRPPTEAPSPLSGRGRTAVSDDDRARRNVLVLILAQAILGSQMAMMFVVGGLAGQSLASNICFATMPISLIVIGSMLAATPLSSIMQKWGRKAGFFIGAGAGALGGIVGAYGLYQASFPIFLLGSLISGIYMSAQAFYRFAAADTASEAFRPKAISYVMAGGLASAVIARNWSKSRLKRWSSLSWEPILPSWH